MYGTVAIRAANLFVHALLYREDRRVDMLLDGLARRARALDLVFWRRCHGRWLPWRILYCSPPMGAAGHFCVLWLESSGWRCFGIIRRAVESRRRSVPPSPFSFSLEQDEQVQQQVESVHVIVDLESHPC